MVRVVVERHCKPDKDEELERLLVELRSTVVKQRGYVSGETLRSIEDPSFWLVLSTWLDVNLWEAWEASAERQEVNKSVEPLLTQPEKVSVFSFVWEASWTE